MCVLLSFFGVQELCVFIWSSQLSVDNVFAYSALETHEICLSLEKKSKAQKNWTKSQQLQQINEEYIEIYK